MAPDLSEYNKPVNIHINNTPIPTTSNPTILGLIFDPKLKFSTHTDNTITKAKNTQSLKTPHVNTLEENQKNSHYHIQNITPSHHRIRQHHLVTHHLIHLPQKIFKNPKRSLENNHRLHLRHQHPTPPLRDQNPPTPKPSQTSRITTHTKSLPPHSSPTPTQHTKSPLQIQKKSTFNNNINYTLNIPPSQTTSHTQIKNNMKTIHRKILHDYISSTHNKILSKQPPPIHESKTTLNHHTRRTLA